MSVSDIMIRIAMSNISEILKRDRFISFKVIGLMISSGILFAYSQGIPRFLFLVTILIGAFVIRPKMAIDVSSERMQESLRVNKETEDEKLDAIISSLAAIEENWREIYNKKGSEATYVLICFGLANAALLIDSILEFLK